MRIRTQRYEQGLKVYTFSKFNITLEKMMVGRLLSFWKGNLSSVMLDFRSKLSKCFFRITRRIGTILPRMLARHYQDDMKHFFGKGIPIEIIICHYYLGHTQHIQQGSPSDQILGMRKKWNLGGKCDNDTELFFFQQGEALPVIRGL